jgi:argininosuccinate lyase
MTFALEYLRLVLDENFEDAKTLFIEPLMAIHAAHLVMLAEQGIVTADDARTIRRALDAIDRDALTRVTYDGSCEDLFFYVNRLIADSCGPDLAGRLHTARSRNDIDMTMYRMLLRDWLLSLAEAVVRLRSVLLDVAERHTRSVFPAHTHGQPAQPTTLAHYLMAVVESLERDTGRLLSAYATVNRNPLGACAITGTGFSIDRDRTSELLGFSGPTGNTYGSIGAVDYLLEPVAGASVLAVGLGRFTQDLLLWATVEIGYLRLPDGFVQISSIMPQKRNPVALEHTRALLSKALGQLNAIAQLPHNTPFGDIVDTEDDLQPLVRTAFRDAMRAVWLLTATMATAEFDVRRMRERAGAAWVSVTELADVLVRDHGLSFGLAHDIVSEVVRRARDGAGDEPAALLEAAGRARGHHIDYTAAELAHILSPENFVEVRRTWGGPSPAVVADAITASRATFAADSDRLAAHRRALTEAAALRGSRLKAQGSSE